MRRFLLFAFSLLLIVGCALKAPPIPPGDKTELDQGPEWGKNTRALFYSTGQGAQIMPLRWMRALKQKDGTPFLAGRLTRYGYLVNHEDPASPLPAGFTNASQIVGMNCAACHTREIQVGTTAYRIDGGPAIADFQSFLADLDTSVKTVLTSQAAFQTFAEEALEPPADPAALRAALNLWYQRYDVLIRKALPFSNPWGPSRLDAVAMIFNRLTGLDIGPAPTYILTGNIQRADAPVRYPFLWNAVIQDKTQWPGFADNGDELLGLARNLGEVYGVFATFHPVPAPGGLLLNVNYRPKDGNSANFKGLEDLEHLIRQIGPPKFPGTVKSDLAKQGEAIFGTQDKPGMCGGCHGIFAGKATLLNPVTWKTQIIDVGTDTREHHLLDRMADTGILKGAYIPLPGAAPLGRRETAFNVLRTAVVGTILDKAFVDASAQGPLPNLAGKPFAEVTARLDGAFKRSEASGAPYESRVMQGIWAAAPYLHNGSVPTLADLLKPAAERPPSFQVGPAYDLDTVGLAQTQTKFDFTYKTTGCEDRNSGNSRCGHEFGTTLTPAEKQALLEYLKQL